MHGVGSLKPHSYVKCQILNDTRGVTTRSDVMSLSSYSGLSIAHSPLSPVSVLIRVSVTSITGEQGKIEYDIMHSRKLSPPKQETEMMVSHDKIGISDVIYWLATASPI